MLKITEMEFYGHDPLFQRIQNGSCDTFSVCLYNRRRKCKLAVFGLLKRGEKVYTKIILDSKKNTLILMVREKIGALQHYIYRLLAW